MSITGTFADSHKHKHNPSQKVIHFPGYFPRRGRWLKNAGARAAPRTAGGCVAPHTALNQEDKTGHWPPGAAPPSPHAPARPPQSQDYSLAGCVGWLCGLAVWAGCVGWLCGLAVWVC